MLFEIAQNHPESLPPNIVKKIREVVRDCVMFQLALKSGVKIAFGTEQERFRTGTAAKELTEMVRLGMTPMDAIVSATKTAAESSESTIKLANRSRHFADLIGSGKRMRIF